VQGIVKTFDSNRGIGIIHGKNGGNYPLILADVITPQPLKTGQLVRFSLRFVNDHAFATNVGVSQSNPFEEPWMNISPADRKSGC
jgi:cold shock CspA family protein